MDKAWWEWFVSSPQWLGPPLGILKLGEPESSGGVVIYMGAWARRAQGSLGIPQICMQHPAFSCVLSRHVLQHGSLRVVSLPTWRLESQDEAGQGKSHLASQDLASVLCHFLVFSWFEQPQVHQDRKRRKGQIHHLLIC